MDYEAEAGVADLDYWFAQPERSAMSTALHPTATFVREQDRLWLNRLLLGDGSGHLCYVFGRSDVCKGPGEQRRLETEYRCGPTYYNTSIRAVCNRYELPDHLCESIRKALVDSCHGTVPGEEKVQTIILNDDVSKRVDVDGRPYLFHAAKDQVKERAAVFCRQLNLREESCATLVREVMKGSGSGGGGGGGGGGG